MPNPGLDGYNLVATYNPKLDGNNAENVLNLLNRKYHGRTNWMSKEYMPPLCSFTYKHKNLGDVFYLESEPLNISYES